MNQYEKYCFSYITKQKDNTSSFQQHGATGRKLRKEKYTVASNSSRLRARNQANNQETMTNDNTLLSKGKIQT